MKKLYLILIASLVASNVNAAGTTVAASTSSATNAQQQSNTGFNNGQGIVLGGGGSGSGLGNNNSQTYAPAVDLSKSVGNAYAPALTTTLTETCMGSTSVGAGFSGGAFSFGTTWRDHACVRRLDAREIHTYGDIQAAKEIMCDSDLVKAAFKRVGRPCAEDGGQYTTTPEVAPVAAAAPAVVAPVATDVKVHDDADTIARKNAAILKAADDAREIMRSKGY